MGTEEAVRWEDGTGGRRLRLGLWMATKQEGQLVHENIPFVARKQTDWKVDWVGCMQVKLHDYGCTLKAYRACLMSNLRLHGDMHRFIPALAAMEGAAISEIEVQHHPRTLGKSKYGLSRIFRFILDLTTLCFLATLPGQADASNGIPRRSLYNRLPFHGRLCKLVPGEGHPGLGIQRGHLQRDSVSCTHRRASHHGLAARVLGAAEVCVRTYYESRPQPVYRVREVATSAIP